MPSNNLNIKKDDIVKARDNTALIKKAALQVAKDFAEFSIEIDVPEELEMVYDELFDQVNHIISDLLNNPSSILQSLLYRIDLHEKDMQTAFSANTKQTRAIILTELILNRAMQKVMLREYFKQQGI
jgi:hypothetical protein